MAACVHRRDSSSLDAVVVVAGRECPEHNALRCFVIEGTVQGRSFHRVLEFARLSVIAVDDVAPLLNKRAPIDRARIVTMTRRRARETKTKRYRRCFDRPQGKAARSGDSQMHRANPRSVASSLPVAATSPSRSRHAGSWSKYARHRLKQRYLGPLRW